MSAWKKLLLLRTDRKTVRAWKSVLGDGHVHATPFFRPCTGQRAETYDCPETGARMAIREHGDQFLAYATGADAGLVEDVVLGWDEVQTWGIHEEALLEALAQCLGVTGTPRELGCGAAFLGRCSRGAREHGVYLCRALDDAGLVQQISGVTVDAGGPCCVLAAEVVESAERFSRETGAAYVALSRCFRFENGGLKGDCGAPCEGLARGVTIGELGEKLERGFEQVIRVRRADAERIDQQRQAIEDMAEGPDKFLAGLQGQLTKKERELFFELIDRMQDGACRRTRSLTEIGQRLGGITKQAISKRVEKLFKKHAGLACYVRAIREPEVAQVFSEMSPSDRKKHGIEKSYNYDAG